MWRPRPATVMTASSIVLAFAPKCPICFLAYFGVLGVAAASASAYRIWLPPITALWLALTIVLLALGRNPRGRVGPVALGLVAAAAVFVGRFNLENRLIVVAGLGGLIAATLWRAWSRQRLPNCNRCDPAATNYEATWRTERAEKFIDPQSL